MVNKPKAIGTRAETAVVRVLRTGGWPHAERRALTGAQDQGDITGTPGICWEVKGGDAARKASDGQIIAWMAETAIERITTGTEVGVLVVQRAGYGEARADRWWAIVPLFEFAVLCGGALPPADLAHAPVRLILGDLIRLLRHAGYGEPLTTTSPTKEGP